MNQLRSKPYDVITSQVRTLTKGTLPPYLDNGCHQGADMIQTVPPNFQINTGAHMDNLSKNDRQELQGCAQRRCSTSTTSSSISQAAERGPRTANACDQCKRRKTKCSGRPHCEACQKAAYSCRFDDGHISKSPLKVKTTTDDNQVQNLLNGVLNAIKYNQTPIFSDLLDSLRRGTPIEIADHLGHNLVALQRRGIIPDESIDQGYLLSLASRVSINVPIGPLPPESSTDMIEYSSVPENPIYTGKSTTGAGTQDSATGQTPCVNSRVYKRSMLGLSAEEDSFSPPRDQDLLSQHSTALRQPPPRTKSGFREASEPVNHAATDLNQYYSITPYQTGDLATSRAPAYEPDAYVQNLHPTGEAHYSALPQLNLDYFPVSSDEQPHSFGDLRRTSDTFPYTPLHSDVRQSIQQHSITMSSPWMQEAAGPLSQISSNDYLQSHFNPMQPSPLPQEQMQVRTEPPAQPIPIQYHHHAFQLSQRRQSDAKPAMQGPKQAAAQPYTVQSGFSSSFFNTSIPEEVPGFTQ